MNQLRAATSEWQRNAAERKARHLCTILGVDWAALPLDAQEEMLLVIGGGAS